MLWSLQVVVQGLPFAYSWQDLKDLFKPVGGVKADIVMGRDERSKGWGTVLFDSEADAERAIQVLHALILSPDMMQISELAMCVEEEFLSWQCVLMKARQLCWQCRTLSEAVQEVKAYTGTRVATSIGSLPVRLLGVTVGKECLLGLVVCQDVSLAYFVHSLNLC